MNQVTQKLKDGQINITEVPLPACGPGDILVWNAYSCISAGTESGTVSAARKSVLGKIKERPQQARQVWEKLLSQGPAQTYRAVMKKLDAHSPLGYSCVGRVIAVGEDVRGFAAGDYAACGGKSASHAEVVAVPQNLAVKIDPGVDLKQAAYNTIGAITMQGVRQADLRLGEICAVIGLGLLGQLTCQLLRAAGVRVVGIDVSPKAVQTAAERCADFAITRGDPAAEQRVLEFTGGMGCDAIIITAATHALDPINFAGAIARKKGTIVVVGDVPTGFDREPHYYNKELQVKMSCSYGPGRYDPEYEDKGVDYPYGYVRWTERRNMAAFQELVRSKRVDLSYLTTHVLPLADAAKAYEMILTRSEPFLGVLIEYDAGRDITAKRVQIPARAGKTAPAGGVRIGFIGAGSYAQGHLLPNLPKDPDVVLKGVVTATPTGTRSAADRFGFEFCTSDPAEIIGSKEINTVFIATRHDSHGQYVAAALAAGKHVFVEKPLCLKEEELTEITRLMENPPGGGPPPLLMVGFNRRFAPLTGVIRKVLRPDPMAVIYRVNAGAVKADDWSQDPVVGGGRIHGEACHFIDYITFLTGSLPVSVFATAMREPAGLNDTVTLSIHYANGSIGTVHYFANGAKTVAKEYVEVYQSGITAILDDYRVATVSAKGPGKPEKLWTQDKGQGSEVAQFIATVRQGGAPLIPYAQLRSTALVCLRAMESLKTGTVMALD